MSADAFYENSVQGVQASFCITHDDSMWILAVRHDGIKHDNSVWALKCVVPGTSGHTAGDCFLKTSTGNENVGLFVMNTCRLGVNGMQLSDWVLSKTDAMLHAAYRTSYVEMPEDGTIPESFWVDFEYPT